MNVPATNNARLAIEWVNATVLNPNPWNSNHVSPENEEKLERSMDHLGMFKPILVRTLNDGTLQIIGGEHRAEIARRKGIDVPIVNLGSITDQRAKEIGLVDNGRYGADDALSLAEILESLDKEDLSFLPYSDNELASIFSSTDIDLSDIDLDDDIEQQDPADPGQQRAPQTHQIIRFKVPIEDAHLVTDLIERIMKDQKLTDSDALTNAGDALIHVLSQLTDSVSND